MQHGPQLLFAIGALLVLGIFAKSLLRRFAIPALVGPGSSRHFNGSLLD